MRLISAIFLVTQLRYMEAECQPGEYEINGSCCPMCSPGSRVFKVCTQFTSTTCKPCVDDTYTEHPNGLMECMRCKVCDAGARLSIKEKCTYTKNTVCGCALGDFCALPANRDCEMCSQYTICLPGSMVKIPGTEFNDNLCEKCPPGTFSITNMSHTCQQWTNCKEQGKTEQKAGTSTSDAICVESSHNLPVILVVVVLFVLVPGVAGLAWFVRRKYCLIPAQETGNGPRNGNLALAGENGTNANSSVQESCGNGSKPIREENNSLLRLENERGGT